MKKDSLHVGNKTVTEEGGREFVKIIMIGSRARACESLEIYYAFFPAILPRILLKVSRVIPR